MFNEAAVDYQLETDQPKIVNQPIMLNHNSHMIEPQ